MDAIARSLAIYIVLLIIFRISGKRSLAQITTFDFVLLLIIGEATQQAMLGDDFSITNAFIIILTLLGADVALSLVKGKSERVEKIVDGVPLVLIENGKMLKDRMKMVRVDEADILSAARRLQGLERLDQIKYAVIETDGGITVIPEPGERS